MKYLNLLFITLLLLSPCKEDGKNRIVRLVAEWQGKEIVFPKEIIFTRHASDPSGRNRDDTERYRFL